MRGRVHGLEASRGAHQELTTTNTTTKGSGQGPATTTTTTAKGSGQGPATATTAWWWWCHVAAVVALPYSPKHKTATTGQ